MATTTTWILLAIGLLIVLTVLLIGPYVGLYGTRRPFEGRREPPGDQAREPPDSQQHEPTDEGRPVEDGGR